MKTLIRLNSWHSVNNSIIGFKRDNVDSKTIDLQKLTKNWVFLVW